MTLIMFSSYLICLCLWKMALPTNLKLSMYVRQESGFIPADVGTNLTLQCFYKGDIGTVFFWYKQTLGGKPSLISSFYKHDKNGTFSDNFKNNPRFTLDTKDGKNHLTISNLRVSDTATYYCISCSAYKFEFAEGTVVNVKGSGLNIPALVHQSASETIQPGGSETLNCTVHTGTSDGEHRVYWFRRSEESHPGLIYTHGGREDHICVYNLPMKSLNLSHAGTYYCAVASCGYIMFGNGTKLAFEDEVDSLVFVYILSGALAFTSILVVLLAFSVYKMKKRSSCQCTAFQSFNEGTKLDNQDGNNLHYAAVRFTRPTDQEDRDDTRSECVYSSVRQ